MEPSTKEMGLIVESLTISPEVTLWIFIGPTINESIRYDTQDQTEIDLLLANIYPPEDKIYIVATYSSSST